MSHCGWALEGWGDMVCAWRRDKVRAWWELEQLSGRPPAAAPAASAPQRLYARDVGQVHTRKPVPRRA